MYIRRTLVIIYTCHLILLRGKGKADPLQAWSGPEGSRNLTPNIISVFKCRSVQMGGHE